MKAISYYFALLLVLGLLSHRAAAQYSSPNYRIPGRQLLQPMRQEHVPNAGRPTGLIDPLAPLPVEPDTAVRRAYARQRVRSVVKVLLNDKGQVKDTIELQEIDERGRRISQLRRGPDWEERRQWSYDANDHCTSLIISPGQGRNFTTIYTYNPALGRGRCEVLQANGKRTLVCEVQRRQRGDTLVTEACFSPAPVNNSPFQTTGCRRHTRYHAAPDTLVTLVDTYSARGQLSGRQIHYEFQFGGQPRERGQLDVARAIRQYQRTADPSVSSHRFPLIWVPRLLRTATTCLQPATITRYDAAGRPVQEENIGRLFTPVTVSSRVITRNTYNELNQLIGQQRHLLGTYVSQGVGYVVFSYQPDGLPAGETSRAGGPPLFYRYHYSYGR